MSTRASLNVVVTALLCLVICSMFLSNFYAQAVPVNKTGKFVQTYRFNAPGCNIRDLDSAELVHVTDLCYQELFGWSSASCYPNYGMVQTLCRKGCGKCDDTTKVRLNGCVSTSTDSTLTACGPLALNLPDSMMWRLSYPLAKIGTDCNPENLAPINIIKAKGVTTNTCSPVPNSQNGEYQATKCSSTSVITTYYKDSACQKPVGGYYGKTVELLRCTGSGFKYTCNV